MESPGPGKGQDSQLLWALGPGNELLPGSEEAPVAQ